ncbi:MAG: preprotein translocase subunit YajC [Bdellovibrionales bacterium]|nr:preprotein translocase subunit YajC [Bdellovibrionales bacterium]
MNRIRHSLFGIIAGHALAPFALADGAPVGPQGGFGPFVPMILMFGILYFLIIRPQQKKQKAQQKFLSELKKGEMVITNAGIVGTIKNLSDKLVTLEVDNNVCIKMLRTQILESANSLKPNK